jgi:hypothetical protein
MALPTTPEMQELAGKAVLAHMREQEQLLRDMLGQWVSGLEPVILYGRDSLMQMKGIGIKDDPTGTVVVPNPHWRPGFWEMLDAARI